MIEIKAPEFCPSCKSKLEWTNNLLFCRNSSCSTKVEKQLEHFAKEMKIKGLGPATIAKLEISSISELYELSEEQIAEAIGSRVLASKLYDELENSLGASLNRLLPAFAIPLVGTTASEKLAKVCDNIYDIDEWTCRQAGLGEKTTKNLLDWINSNKLLIELLPFNFKFEKPKATGRAGIICITGKLNSYKTKAEAQKVLESLGYIVKPSLTKDVMILVNEGGVESAKTIKARESGVIIVTNLKDFLEEK